METAEIVEIFKKPNRPASEPIKAEASAPVKAEGGYCSELWKMYMRRELTLKELELECAGMILEHIEDLRFRAYPTKSELIKGLCKMSEPERRKKLEEKATPRERDEARAYCESFSRVKSMNWTSYQVLQELQGQLEDPADKEKVSAFMDRHFEPVKLRVYCQPYDIDPTEYRGRNYKAYTDIFIFATLVIRGIAG
jgi:hypothetical protein